VPPDTVSSARRVANEKETGVLHARTLVKCANVGFLVVGAVAIAGSGGLGGCSSKSSSGSSDNDAAGGSSGGLSDSGYGITASGVDGSTTIFSGSAGPVELPQDADSCNGGACNGLVLSDAPVIEETLVPGSPPAFTGGTLSDGTYYLTSVAIYGGSVVSDVTVEGGFGDDAGDDGAIGATSDGASDATSDGSSGTSSDAANGTSADASINASSDGAVGDGASDAGIDGGNGTFVEEVISISADATIAQFASANGSGCTVGTVHLSTSGSKLTMAPFCGNPFNPTQAVMTWPYTATSTTITASVPAGGGATAVLTLTMQ
jgi:hypothetical protein